jgi:hypothetical protein
MIRAKAVAVVRLGGSNSTLKITELERTGKQTKMITYIYIHIYTKLGNSFQT